METIYTNQRAPHADPVQQRTLGEFLVNLIVAERQFHRIDGEQRIEVFIVPVGTWLTNQSSISRTFNRGCSCPIRATGTGRIFPIDTVNGIQAARHIQ